MNTNGSAQNELFWSTLAKLNVVIRFGIDGLDDTHCLYRIGTDWNKIIKNATVFIDNGGYAIWDMLVFEHNKHQVDACRDLSQQLGFKEFYSKNTSRFKDDKLNVIDKQGRTIHVLYPTNRSKQILTDTTGSVVNCKVAKEKNLYIGASGNVSPCCWLELSSAPIHNPNRIDYMDKIGKYPNLHESTLSEIFDSGFFNMIQDTWSCNPLKECSKQCGKVDKFNEQFR